MQDHCCSQTFWQYLASQDVAVSMYAQSVERMQAMADQGSGGAFEISQRMTAMIGWGATTGFAEKWVFDQAADTYALDQEMADKLRK